MCFPNVNAFRVSRSNRFAGIKRYESHSQSSEAYFFPGRTLRKQHKFDVLYFFFFLHFQLWVIQIKILLPYFKRIFSESGFRQFAVNKSSRGVLNFSGENSGKDKKGFKNIYGAETVDRSTVRGWGHM